MLKIVPFWPPEIELTDKIKTEIARLFPIISNEKTYKNVTLTLRDSIKERKNAFSIFTYFLTCSSTIYTFKINYIFCQKRFLHFHKVADVA